MKFEDLVRVLEEEKKPTMSRIAPGFYSAVQEYINELEEADRKISRRRLIRYSTGVHARLLKWLLARLFQKTLLKSLMILRI